MTPTAYSIPGIVLSDMAIISAVCHNKGTTVDAMMNDRTRRRETVDVKHQSAFLVEYLMQRRAGVVAEMFGYFNHGAINHIRRTVVDLYDVDPAYRRDLINLGQNLGMTPDDVQQMIEDRREMIRSLRRPGARCRNRR